MVTLIGTFMLFVFFILGVALAFAPWIGLVLYLKRKNGTQIVGQRAYRPPGPRMDGKDWLILIGTIFYLISPLDLLPDVFLGLGWCDDLGLLAFTIKHFYSKFWGNKDVPSSPPDHYQAPRYPAISRRNYDDDAIDAEFEVHRHNQLVEARRRR